MSFENRKFNVEERMDGWRLELKGKGKVNVGESVSHCRNSVLGVDGFSPKQSYKVTRSHDRRQWGHSVC